jgi:hypothetical protein
VWGHHVEFGLELWWCPQEPPFCISYQVGVITLGSCSQPQWEPDLQDPFSYRASLLWGGGGVSPEAPQLYSGWKSPVCSIVCNSYQEAKPHTAPQTCPESFLLPSQT